MLLAGLTLIMDQFTYAEAEFKSENKKISQVCSATLAKNNRFAYHF